MIGIERLRAIAGAWDEWGLGGTLAEIADEIERELREERDRWDNDLSEAQVSWNAVAGVCLDMERHFLGHEGMEDSPVARWARELLGALKSDASDGSEAQNPSCVDAAETADVTSEAQKVTRDPAEDVSVSAYDLLPADERDAIAWVRERGGLDYVKKEWRSRVPYDRYVRRRQRLLGHIAECETALGRRREIISKLTHHVKALANENVELRRRAMPEGMEWPRYEDGELVEVGDPVSGGFFNRSFNVFSVEFRDDETYLHEGFKSDYVVAVHPGERVKRPVLDADGVPINEGDTVYWLDSAVAYTVVSPHEMRDNAGRELKCGHTVAIALEGHEPHRYVHPESLHHTKPEPYDSWERIKEDLSKSYTEYWGCVDVICNRCPAEIDGKKPHERFDACSHNCILAMRHDIVRRCRALAEKESRNE